MVYSCSAFLDYRGENNPNQPPTNFNAGKGGPECRLVGNPTSVGVAGGHDETGFVHKTQERAAVHIPSGICIGFRAKKK